MSKSLLWKGTHQFDKFHFLNNKDDCSISQESDL